MFHCQFLFILFTILAKFCSMLLYHVREKCVAMYVRLMLDLDISAHESFVHMVHILNHLLGTCSQML
jgi:hypothetical protein